MSHIKRKKKLLPADPDFASIVKVGSFTTTFNTATLFDPGFIDTKTSPIDQFLNNTNSLNIIYLNTNPLTPVLANLVFLGYVSAVESYVRALIRGLINIDEYAQRIVETRPVSYGAAIHHSPHLMPEALMEGSSLADPDTIKSTLEKLVGISLPLSELKKPFDEFNKLCHLRHCCIHRFGKLGVNNAIELGLLNHKHLLEKPIHLTKDDLNNIADTLRTFVKTLNNTTYRSILERTMNRTKKNNRQIDDPPKYTVSWTWDYRRDKGRFKEYYDLFSTKVDTIASPSDKEMYLRFRNVMQC